MSIYNGEDILRSTAWRKVRCYVVAVRQKKIRNSEGNVYDTRLIARLAEAVSASTNY